MANRPDRKVWAGLGRVVRKGRLAVQADETSRARLEAQAGREVQGSLGRAVQGMADRSGRQSKGSSGFTSRQAGQVRETS